MASSCRVHRPVQLSTRGVMACVETQQTEPRVCQANLNRDWPRYSGDRPFFAVVAGLVPLPIVWIVADFALRAPRQARLGPTWSAHHYRNAERLRRSQSPRGVLRVAGSRAPRVGLDSKRKRRG